MILDASLYPSPEEMDDPYQTCAYGRHNWRMTSQGESDEDTQYVCTECGSTDPEGDQAK